MRNRKLVREPLHRQIAEALRQEITAKFKPGARLPSELELARQFDVSIPTLREALRSLAQDGLINRCHGSGTYVADRPAHGLVAVVTEFTLWELQRSRFFLRLLDRVRANLDDAGQPHQLYVPVQHWHPDRRDPVIHTLLDDARHRRLAGMVVLGQHWPADWLKTVRAAGVPVAGSAALHERGLCDFGLGIADLLPLALDHLVRHNRRRVGVMQWTSPGLGPQAAAQLRDRIAAELARHGCEVREPWICVEANPNLPGAGWERFRELWAAGRPRPDALVLGDDVLFQEVQLAITELRLAVPADLRVVVQTNLATDLHTIFPIVACELDTDRYAALLVEQLLDLIRGQPIAQPCVTLPLRLVEEGADAEPAPAAVASSTVNPNTEQECVR